jgi:hypothetical protein
MWQILFLTTCRLAVSYYVMQTFPKTHLPVLKCHGSKLALPASTMRFLRTWLLVPSSRIKTIFRSKFEGCWVMNTYFLSETVYLNRMGSQKQVLPYPGIQTFSLTWQLDKIKQCSAWVTHTQYFRRADPVFRQVKPISLHCDMAESYSHFAGTYCIYSGNPRYRSNKFFKIVFF